MIPCEVINVLLKLGVEMAEHRPDLHRRGDYFDYRISDLDHFPASDKENQI